MIVSRLSTEQVVRARGDHQVTHRTSITVLPFRLHRSTHLSSRKVTLHTASQGSESSLISLPDGLSQSFTLPSLPPVTMKRSLNYQAEPAYHQ